MISYFKQDGKVDAWFQRLEKGIVKVSQGHHILFLRVLDETLLSPGVTHASGSRPN